MQDGRGVRFRERFRLLLHGAPLPAAAVAVAVATVFPVLDGVALSLVPPVLAPPALSGQPRCEPACRGVEHTERRSPVDVEKQHTRSPVDDDFWFMAPGLHWSSAPDAALSFNNVPPIEN